MAEQSILLFVSDRPVRSSLQFALSLDGFSVGDGLEVRDRSRATGLVIDQACGGDGMGVLASLRAAGCAAPAVLLATNPTRALRARAAERGAVIVEKPLLGDDLPRALRAMLNPDEAA